MQKQYTITILKSTITGDYLDLCNTCYHEIQQDTSVKERDDLRTEEETFEDDIE